jgi:hypothetical protein
VIGENRVDFGDQTFNRKSLFVAVLQIGRGKIRAPSQKFSTLLLKSCCSG